MLVLSRKEGESVILTMPDGRRGRVCVVGIRGESVRIGFEFPDDVQVNREELQVNIDRERAAGRGR